MSTIVAQNAKRIIREKGLKQRFVAEKAHLGERTISDLLCGRKIITANHISILCKALDVEVGELFRDTG